jgi:hypothetical protein
VVRGDGGILEMTVRHEPWRVRSLAGKFSAAELGRPWGLRLAGPPDLAHFAPEMPAWIERFRPAELSSSW